MHKVKFSVNGTRLDELLSPSFSRAKTFPNSRIKIHCDTLKYQYQPGIILVVSYLLQDEYLSYMLLEYQEKDSMTSLVKEVAHKHS